MGSVDLTGLTEKKNRAGTVYYEDADGCIVAKICRRCNENKGREEYNRKDTGLGGRSAECRKCRAKYNRKYHEDNRDHILKKTRKWSKENKDRKRMSDRKWREENKRLVRGYSRKWAQANRERVAETSRIWAIANPDKRTVSKQNRRARERSLPNTLSDLQREANYAHFGNTCVLTGESDNLELEHAIPLATGHGGTTRENCVPMSASLNASKGDRNIFDWFPQVKEHYGLSQHKFDELVTYLAELNGLSPKEYEDFVYWCHTNPRTTEETEEDNARYGYKKPSIEIWREATEGKAIS